MQQNRHVQYLNNKEVHPQKNNTREATQLETLPVPRSTTGDDDDATMMMMLLRAALRRRAGRPGQVRCSRFLDSV